MMFLFLILSVSNNNINNNIETKHVDNNKPVRIQMLNNEEGRYLASCK